MEQTAIPWYKSKIIVGALASVATKALVALGVPAEIAGAGSGEVANLVVLGVGVAADAIILRSRTKQKEAPAIVASAASAELKKLEHVQQVPMAEVEADRAANVQAGLEVEEDEPFPSQATAATKPIEAAPASEDFDEDGTRLIKFGELVTEEFKNGVLWIEEQIGLDADKLMCCMHFETGGTFSPSVKNAAGSSGTGLIQFMRATIEGPQGMLAKRPALRKVASSHAALAKLTAVQQLTFVYYYFKAFGNDLSDWSLEDVYMAILYPKAIGKPLSWPMPWKAGSLAYKQNSGLDLNKDKVITKAEAAAGVTKRWALGEQMKG